ncbi:MAG: SGNH/GDSL hydrolase family protein, partial [Actinomycetes bacterium]
MSRADRARRVARRAAYSATVGGGGAGLAGAGLLTVEALIARRVIPRTQGRPPLADGTYGPGSAPGRPARVPVRLVLLGDSLAAGYGTSEPTETPGAIIAWQVAQTVDRPVELRTAAVVGARSADLLAQVDQVRDPPPDIAVVMVGANDVTGRVRPSDAAGGLVAAVEALHELGARVVVGTCPDLGTVRPVHQPLRWVA